MLLKLVNTFLADEQGQDLIEYTLLVGFMMLCSVAIVITGGHSISGIWTSTSTQLAAANSVVPGH